MTDPTTVTLAELGVDDDPGTSWHPSKPEAFDADGLLLDLDEATVAAHATKPEVDDQADAGTEPLSAEDSAHSDEGVV